MEAIGYILAIIMGMTLGLLGGGGSILTVPILVYVLAVDPVLATAYSLFVVGSTSLIGSIKKSAEKLVNWRIAITFAIPSLLAVFATRYFLVPALPDVIFSIFDYPVTREMAIMVFFALIMLLAAWSMMRRRAESSEENHLKKVNILKVIAEGLVVGLITGLVGAGGGFLIVPALVLLVGLSMKQAVGTSLVIITVKSLIGFLGDIGSGQLIEWPFLLLFTGFSIIGLFLGVYVSRFISGASLKKVFGWFIVLMAIFILYKELV